MAYNKYSINGGIGVVIIVNITAMVMIITEEQADEVSWGLTSPI